MSLIITFMFEPAKLQMNWASASGAMNARGDLTQLAVAVACSERAVLTRIVPVQATCVREDDETPSRRQVAFPFLR
jgi:hypothetical protein